MDINLEDDDHIVLIVSKEDDEDNNDNTMRSTTIKPEGPIKNMQFPVTIKVQPLEEDEIVSLNVENILKSAAEHGHLIKIKQEKPDDCEELNNSQPKKTKNTIHSTKKPLKKMTKKKIEANKNTRKALKHTPETHKNCNNSSYKPPVSCVEELRLTYPEFKTDREQLISHLANMMRLEVPPDPPRDYCTIDLDGKLICSFCEIKTLTLPAAARHYQNCHGTHYLRCYACGSDFWSKPNLYKHEKRCTEPDAEIVLQARGQYLGRKGRGRPYISNTKFKPRMNPLDPVTGEEKVPAAKKYTCSFCPAEFIHKKTWETHENIHNGTRPFKCQLCPAAYFSKMGLKKHRLTHENQKFICDHCKKSFKLRVNLISHMNTHLPQRKYGCDMCSKRYAQKSALTVHINRDHLNLPAPCACPQCPKRYPRMSHLRDHMLKAHGLKMMTRKMLFSNLPKLNMLELKGAKVVFQDPVAYNNAATSNETVDDPCFEAVDYLEIADEDTRDSVHEQTKVVTQKTPFYNMQLSAS